MVAKKTPAKKTNKKTLVRKPVRKSSKSVIRKKSVSKKPAQMKSFRVYKDDQPFVTFRLTRQTFYWAILLVFIIITQLWLLQIQMDIAELTDSLMAQ